MSQTPNSGDYFSQDSAPVEPYPPAETYETVDPYATPADPYTTPVDPYATPTDPYATPTTDYVAAEPYVASTTYTETTGSGATGTADVAKDEAANVKDTAVQEGQQVAGTAKEEAKNVAGTAVEAGQQVAGTAKEEAKNVAAETTTQVRDLARTAASELHTQAGSQQQKVAELVHSYAKELGSMASSSNESGPLTDLAHKASAKAGEIGHWLENREPRDLVSELSSFARRRPGAFLLGAAVAGVVAGRLTRNLASEAKDQAAPAATGPTYAEPSYAGGYSDPSYATSTYADTPTYTDTSTYSEAAPASMVTEVEDQTGRYGDLASEDQVVGYDTPVRTTGQDIR